MYNSSAVCILICVMSLYFNASSTTTDEIHKGTAELIHDQQNCRFENHFQISGRLHHGQTRATESTIYFGSRKGTDRGALARYNITRVDLKTFTFSAMSKSRSIDNSVLRPSPNAWCSPWLRTLISMARLDTNPYKFRHNNISEFSLYVNGKLVPSEGLTLEMDYENMSVMCYRALFVSSGIHHSNPGLQVTCDIYMNGYWCSCLISFPTGVPRRHTRHSIRMALSRSNCNLASYYPSRSHACCSTNVTVQS